MSKNILVSDKTYARLQGCVEPFVDKEPEDVIIRLLNDYENANGSADFRNSSRTESMGGDSVLPRDRNPRERGTTVKINDHRIDAVSVRDLYKQALKYLLENHEGSLKQQIPFKTSDARYLLNTSAKHPRGNPFVIPMEYEGYYMEAHKDYKNGIAHLRRLVERLGLTFEYLG
ncbi:MAG: hypothetical protein IH872_00485 [Chloroflexi bacterium]|nr:hypothetical protein [Chloroflexota bacterium]